MSWHTYVKMLGAAALVLTVALGVGRVAPVVSGQEDGMGQIAGTWLWMHQFGPMGALPALATFTKDGTVIVASGGMFGNPLSPLPTARNAKEGPLHGVYERTGAGTFVGVTYFLHFDASGMISGFGRARTTVHLVDRDHLQGASYLEMLEGCTLPPAAPLACPDPLDPDAAWVAFPMMPPEGFPVTGTRVR